MPDVRRGGKEKEKEDRESCAVLRPKGRKGGGIEFLYLWYESGSTSEGKKKSNTGPPPAAKGGGKREGV